LNNKAIRKKNQNLEFKLWDGQRLTTTYERIENNSDESEDVMD